MLSFRIQAVLGGLLFISAGQAFSAAQNFPVKTVSMPAWNIITDTLMKMTPLIEGRRDDGVMSLVCDLARGNKSQRDIDDILQKKNIDMQALAKAPDAMRLLVNHDIAAQQTACSVYLMTSLFVPVDNSVYMQEDTSATKKEEAGKETVKTDKAKAGANVKSSVAKIFNQPRFEADVRAQIAIAQATAQLYAIVAGNLERSKGESWGFYQASTTQMISDYAPDFLKTVTAFYQNGAPGSLAIRQLTAKGYDVFDANNHQLQRDQNEFLFRSRNVDWLGNSSIMGKPYYVALKIINVEEKSKGSPQHSKKR
ncbi:hypothetical protein [Yokenella regensburgei]|jgi:hypothetical protein|uniref:Uncharacterized protein n=1 Tax=Yokenella regensburgei TaxID=158877 RepID=A0AB38FSJ5_9ENTR|nr:hypothetical protein [Yokenella regensburgei]EHM47605.1 hypothetical protein HMPREF0880_03354 [Yokenella regensburgei ATCC 43003]KAF1366674.1 hypothetical protein FHR25_004867 [Yokenella regensburgei]KFD20443.1 putative exported protein [Yokenella regensburgei ATCC 49455]MDQ4427761.1 hypothetical protein [Yokenella regensburgei]SQA60729.1 Uncharacterised protein [Yokenella regensburgei]